MHQRETETIKLAATFLANISAISFGVALFERSPLALFCGCGNGIYHHSEAVMYTASLIAFLVCVFGYGQYVARRKHD